MLFMYCSNNLKLHKQNEPAQFHQKACESHSSHSKQGKFTSSLIVHGGDIPILPINSCEVMYSSIKSDRCWRGEWFKNTQGFSTQELTVRVQWETTQYV